jgi:hypothetical protein
MRYHSLTDGLLAADILSPATPLVSEHARTSRWPVGLFPRMSDTARLITSRCTVVMQKFRLFVHRFGRATEPSYLYRLDVSGRPAGKQDGAIADPNALSRATYDTWRYNVNLNLPFLSLLGGLHDGKTALYLAARRQTDRQTDNESGRTISKQTNHSKQLQRP